MILNHGYFGKKTYTNVLLNFNAVVPNCWKNGLIICLLKRAWNICSIYILTLRYALHHSIKTEFGGQCLPFLDVNIKLEGNDFESWIFRKKITQMSY